MIYLHQSFLIDLTSAATAVGGLGLLVSSSSKATYGASQYRNTGVLPPFS